MRQNLQHLFWTDQRRGWRYTNPNLEQLGLIKAKYKEIDDIAADADEFTNSPILAIASTSERKRALIALYDHLRKGLAVDCTALQQLKLEELSGKNQTLIKSPWNVDDDKLVGSTIFMTDPPRRLDLRNRDEDRLLRGSPTSAIGKKLRELTYGGEKIELKDVPEILEGLLKASENYGTVVRQNGSFGGVGGSSLGLQSSLF